jgi:hypothetical protein
VPEPGMEVFAPVSKEKRTGEISLGDQGSG